MGGGDQQRERAGRDAGRLWIGPAGQYDGHQRPQNDAGAMPPLEAARLANLVHITFATQSSAPGSAPAGK